MNQQFDSLKGFWAPETPTVCANVRFAFAVYTIFLIGSWKYRYPLTLLVGVSGLIKQENSNLSPFT